jgi:hypothetical protein
MKIPLTAFIETTEKIKREARENEDLLAWMGDVVKESGAWHELVVGRDAYHVYGGGCGVVEVVDGKDVACGGRWYRRDELKVSPWSAGERSEFESGLIERTKRHNDRSDRVYLVWKQRRALAKAFVGR